MKQYIPHKSFAQENKKVPQTYKKAYTIAGLALNGNPNMRSLQTDPNFKNGPFYTIKNLNTQRVTPVGIFVKNEKDLSQLVEEWHNFYTQERNILPLTIFSKNSTFYKDGRQYPIKRDWKSNLLLLDLGLSSLSGKKKDLTYFINYELGRVERYYNYYKQDEKRPGIGFNDPSSSKKYTVEQYLHTESGLIIPYLQPCEVKRIESKVDPFTIQTELFEK